MKKIVKHFGTTYFYKNSLLHREDGPAIEYMDGTKRWYKNGFLHREDGPAIEYADGKKDWYLDDKCYGDDDDFTNDSWIKFVKTLIFS